MVFALRNARAGRGSPGLREYNPRHVLDRSGPSRRLAQRFRVFRRRRKERRNLLATPGTNAVLVLPPSRPTGPGCVESARSIGQELLGSARVQALGTLMIICTAEHLRAGVRGRKGAGTLGMSMRCWREPQTRQRCPPGQAHTRLIRRNSCAARAVSCDMCSDKALDSPRRRARFQLRERGPVPDERSIANSWPNWPPAPLMDQPQLKLRGQGVDHLRRALPMRTQVRLIGAEVSRRQGSLEVIAGGGLRTR